ncbi:phage tail assembly chaperone G [Staphylococcus sp. HMSC056G08]|uniref:phage tail assembly chaperone G n=1 Tax=Staphylococcus sp. HMSC056G08 TaxID=1739350 RepID=UPI0008A51BD5|nr:hypothetical protein [Staphylococcus sp. HMSC056G08]OFJ79136.1 hypothetical protein HMPREF2846_07115 [Staphylococcus sp. HMSC056G08]
MFRITVEIDGKEQEFTQTKKKGKVIKKIAELQDKTNLLEKGEITYGELIDEQYMVIVEMFDNQFTLEQLMDGSDFDEIEDLFEEFNNSGKSKTTQNKRQKKG